MWMILHRITQWETYQNYTYDLYNRDKETLEEHIYIHEDQTLINVDLQIPLVNHESKP